MLALERRHRADSTQFRILKQKLGRNFDSSQTTAWNLAQASSSLKALRKFENDRRLETWKQRLRSSDRECWKWLTKQAVAPNINIDNARNASDSLKVLVTYWQQIWNRTETWHAGLEASRPFLSSTMTLQDEPLDLDVLTSVARSQTGRAASMDGWLGSEVSELPDVVLTQILEYFNLFQVSGMVPSSWKWLKQVHVPKNSDSKSAKDWRPIAVMSIWYRLWSASKFKSLQYQQWFRHWLPPQAVGGKKGGEVYDALCQLDFHQHTISLDFRHAFDTVHPKLALGIFAALGMGRQTINMLEAVWCHQLRYMALDSEFLTTPLQVGSSVPQGDSFSLMAMLAVLVAPTSDLVRRYPRVTLRTFVDDRTFTGPVDQVLAMKEGWREWSSILGLTENETKTIYFHRTPNGRKKFCEFGVAADLISLKPKILGCELKPSHGRTTTDREKRRLQESVHYILKARYLPLPWNKLKVFIVGQGLSRAAWGWFWRLPPRHEAQKVQTAVKKALGESPVASKHLQ